MKTYLDTPLKKVVGIIIIPVDNSKPIAKKYLHVDNTIKGISTFLQFAKKENPQATHVNFYEKETREFVQRIEIS